MTEPSYDATIYPEAGENPTTKHADPNRSPVGVCFSGGGSRALTCAWGQMIGLRNLSVDGTPLLDKVRYISSVSGGTWASVLYTYLPDSISDDDFFTAFVEPENLHLNSAESGGMDVSRMGEHALGRVPQAFANLFDLDPFKNIIADFITIVLIKGLDVSESLKWLWMYIVGNNVLSPFGLYTYDFSLFSEETPWHYDDAMYFSLTRAYADGQIFDNQPTPSPEDFQFVRTDSDGKACRPMLVVNTNLVGEDPKGAKMMGPMQIPVQVTPVSGGVIGSNPAVPGDSVGGGSVESFAFTSCLESKQDGSDRINAIFSRAYSLVDIASVSSAFYAEILAQSLNEIVDNMLEKEQHKRSGVLRRLLNAGESLLSSEAHERLQALHDRSSDFELSDFVPQYDYWAVSEAADVPPVNKSTMFTDGGDLENTGVLGMLAQTDVSKIIAFVNTSLKMEKTDANVIVTAAQVSPLFGIAWDKDTMQFKEYGEGGINPFTKEIDPMGFLKVFDNADDQFAALRAGMYQANGADKQTGPAFFQQSLKVIENPLAGIAAREQAVTVLWVQNARVNNWQEKISDPDLSAAILKGQKDGGLAEFAEFPCYSTFLKIHQSAAETNTLAQMWAWCVASDDSPLRSAIKKLF